MWLLSSYLSPLSDWSHVNYQVVIWKHINKLPLHTSLFLTNKLFKYPIEAVDKESLNQSSNSCF